MQNFHWNRFLRWIFWNQQNEVIEGCYGFQKRLFFFQQVQKVNIPFVEFIYKFTRLFGILGHLGENGGMLKLQVSEALNEEELFNLGVSKLNQMLDDFDGFPHPFVVWMKWVKIFKILGKHELILTESLDRFDHKGLKAHSRFGVFGFF